MEYKEFWNVLFEDGTSEIYVYERAATSQKNAKLITHVIEFSAYEKLKKQNEIMRDALEFYADIERWKTVEHCELKSKIRIDAADFDAKIDNDMMYFIAGKRARQALARCKELEKV